MSTFLIRSATSQSSSYPIALTSLGGPRSRPNPHLKFVCIDKNKQFSWGPSLFFAPGPLVTGVQ